MNAIARAFGFAIGTVASAAIWWATDRALDARADRRRRDEELRR